MAAQALAEGRNPYWTPLLYAPYGAPLYLHTLNLFNGLSPCRSNSPSG